jgi:hypothetical protein
MVEIKKYIGVMMWLLTCALSACDESHEIVTRQVSVQAFESVKINSVFSVTLNQGNEYSVEITADEDIINKIEIDVIDGAVVLTNRAKYKWTSPETSRVEVKITAPTFYSFEAVESYSLKNVGELQIDALAITNHPEVKISEIDLTLHANTLVYWNNWLAGGKLIVRGNVQNLEAWNYALHIIDAGDLVSQNVILHNYGRENCTVNVSEHFEYSLMGPGNIYLYGNPAEVIQLEKSSTGKLIRMP